MAFTLGLLLGLMIGVLATMIKKKQVVKDELEYAYPLAELAREVMVDELPKFRMKDMAREALDFFDHKKETHDKEVM